MMINIETFKNDLILSSLETFFSYSDDEGISIVTQKRIDDNNVFSYINLQIKFSKVARINFIHDNFYERFYTKINFLTGDNNISNFYVVINSEWESERLMIDPTDKYKLKHYIICSNDSYLELFANEPEIIYDE